MFTLIDHRHAAQGTKAKYIYKFTDPREVGHVYALVASSGNHPPSAYQPSKTIAKTVLNLRRLLCPRLIPK